MKEVGTTNWNSPNTDATNTSLFTGLPGGNRNLYGSYSYIGTSGNWWSSTENGNGANFAWYRSLSSYNGDAGRGNDYKKGGFSVRCLKD